MANGKIQPLTRLDQSKHHCYSLSTTRTLFKLASEVEPRTIRTVPSFSLRPDIPSCNQRGKQSFLP